MKKTLIITGAILFVAVAYLTSPVEGKGWFGKGKGEMGKSMTAMCPMHTMMCKGMIEKKMVALEDGSIIIMTNGKLYKYDRDLNLVKDVELKKICDDTKAKIEEMQKQCAEMCKTNMKKEMPKSEE
jgi:hypothetical protein